jgi:hypothetical protein
MNLLDLKTDNDFNGAIVPEGYLLIFYSLDNNGNIVKRYKDSKGNFGDIGGSVNDITEEQAKVIITQKVENIEKDVIEINAILVEANTVSTQLDSIIGE